VKLDEADGILGRLASDTRGNPIREATAVVLAELARLRAIEQRARDQLNGPNRQDAQTARYILGESS
jgi:hypothetical protein